MKIRDFILFKFRSRKLQPLWRFLHHISAIGMNYHGGASLDYSGELYALKYITKKLKGKIIIFDVGANQGSYSKYVNNIFLNNCIIYCFEPSKTAFEILKKNSENFDNIKLFNFGFSDNEKKENLYSPEKGFGYSRASIHKHTLWDSVFEEVRLTSLDSFVFNNGLRKIDLLKLDIEGHELHALKGAKNLIENNKINYIQFEFGECNIESKTYFKDFYHTLNSHYNLFRIVSDGIVPIHEYTPELEFFGSANFLAEKKDLQY